MQQPLAILHTFIVLQPWPKLHVIKCCHHQTLTKQNLALQCDPSQDCDVNSENTLMTHLHDMGSVSYIVDHEYACSKLLKQRRTHQLLCFGKCSLLNLFFWSVHYVKLSV